ncbi:hypothetical protein AAG906_040789 [Vitis piasezkii]
MMETREKLIEEQLSGAIQLVERVRAAERDAHSYKFECSEVWKQAGRIGAMVRSVIRIVTSTPFLYERPIRCVVAAVCRTLERALALVRKCKHRSVLRRVVTIINAADFRKMFSLLEASVGDMKWLLSVVDADGGNGVGGIGVSIAPIASNDPILSWVWSYIASVQMGQLPYRIEAANYLVSIAQDNDRNKRIIAQEGGVPPLLKLMKESASPDAQIAATTALLHLADVQERVRLIADELGVPIIVHVLRNSPMRVQTVVANLVARMAELDPFSQEEFAREHVVRPLVTLLSFEIVMNENDPKMSIHSLVQINKEVGESSTVNAKLHLNSCSSMYGEGSGRGGRHNKDRENEKPEVKIKLKTSCAEALRMLARGNVSNSKRITETKGLLCLAKLIEKEKGDLQFNCLMTIMEITAIAEYNAELRRAVFKINSPAAKAVVNQLVRLIEEVDSTLFQIPAIRALGSLARTFSARETHIIRALVARLSHWDHDVAMEAAIALGKFACQENYLNAEHSDSIIKFGGVTPLMKLMRVNEQTRLHGLILLCHLAIHSGNSESLEQARVLTILEGVQHTMMAQHPDLRELVLQATFLLRMYHNGVLGEGQPYVP